MQKLLMFILVICAYKLFLVINISIFIYHL